VIQERTEPPGLPTWEQQVAFVLSAPRSEQQSEVCLDDTTLVGG
jgi:hypothetical protein